MTNDFKFLASPQHGHIRVEIYGNTFDFARTEAQEFAAKLVQAARRELTHEAKYREVLKAFTDLGLGVSYAEAMPQSLVADILEDYFESQLQAPKSDSLDQLPQSATDLLARG